MPTKPKQLIRLLKRNGFVVVRQVGSHVVMRNDTTNTTTIVPCHSKEMKKGTEQSILKEAGVKRK